MKLYNTLSKRVEELKQESEIGIYTCGPTVYDRVHIGNLAAFIFADTLKRALASTGTAVKHVMNFTDVDDKTIRRSEDQYPDLPPEEALKKLTEHYGRLFLDDMQAIGNDLGSYQFIKATDNIAAMQQLISRLYANKFAYIADDGVYFSIESYKASGKIYGQLTEITAESTSSARIKNDEYDKQSVHDFALWKKQQAGEAAWDFELDGHDLKGRPGWHIECSAMSRATLGQPFYVHTGGVDLIFPHHENEIAQSTAGLKERLYARHFMHSEHILVDGQKMSKSLNNFYTLDDVRAKGYEPLAFRLLVLQSHYRNQVHFSWDNLEAASNRLKDYQAMAALRWQPRAVAHDAATFALRDVPSQLAESMGDDLNTPEALAYLSNVSSQLQAVHIEKDMVDHFEAMLKGIDDLLGLDLSSISDINDHQKQIMADREAARAAKDWAKSDELRAQLLAEGIGLQDHPHGVTWFRA